MQDRFETDATALQPTIPSTDLPFGHDGDDRPPRSNVAYFAGGVVLGLIALIGVFAFTRGNDDSAVDASDASTTTVVGDTTPTTIATTAPSETEAPTTLPLATTQPPTTLSPTTLPPTTLSPTTTPVPATFPVRWPDDSGWEPSDVAYFSGCTPGTPDSLPDGVWFGYVRGVSGAGIDFDLACHYGVGLDENELDEELITNDSARIRALRWSPNAAIWTFDDDVGEVGPMSVDEHVDIGRLDALDEAIITVAGGRVVEVRYRPMAG